MRWSIPAILIPLSLGLAPPAQADPCRITTTDAYLGIDSSGIPSALGLEARVERYVGPGLLASIGSRGVAGARVDFYLVFDGIDEEDYVGSAVTGRDGVATAPLADHLRREGDVFTLSLTGPTGAVVTRRLTRSTFMQVVARAPEGSSECDGGEIPADVYGAAYFRHPSDTAPILFSDVDDTLFDSADVSDLLTIVVLNHYSPIDGDVVAATHAFRDAGGVFIGLTAQPAHQRALTRSEMLRFDFDDPYGAQAHYYDDEGYDGVFQGRTLSFLANDDYARGAMTYSFDHCDFKVEQLDRVVNGVFGGQWGEVMGLIGDTQGSDGCASFYTGLHWYALMEGSDVVETSGVPEEELPPSPEAYTEIHGGWSVALPLVCGDAGLDCQ